MNVRSHPLSQTLTIIAFGAVLGLGAMPSVAAERVLLKYGPISRSVPVRDLRQFADTGRPTRKLRRYLRAAKQNPVQVQNALTRPADINPVQLDRLLNSAPGDLLLREVGEVIHTPTDRANRRALRSALILDASDDRQITLIDTLENYPTPEVTVEGDRLVKVIRRFNQFRAYGERAQPAAEILGQGDRPFLERLIEGIDSLLK